MAVLLLLAVAFFLGGDEFQLGMIKGTIIGVTLCGGHYFLTRH